MNGLLAEKPCSEERGFLFTSATKLLTMIQLLPHRNFVL